MSSTEHQLLILGSKIMQGFVNYFYKDGNPPTHTKTAFAKHKLLTVHSIIVKNALIFMHKIHHMPLSLPQSVRDTIPADAPTLGSDHVSCENWLKKFGDCYHNKSVFYKGPLLAATPSIAALATSDTLFFNIKPYKTNTTRMLLEMQALGDQYEWEAGNFLLHNISGLRRSTRNS